MYRYTPNRQCEEFIEKEIKDYLEFNNNEDISSSVLWDALKAVLRGKLIMCSSRKKKEKEKQLSELTTKLKILERKHMEQNGPHILEEINTTKQKLNKILDNQVEIKLKYIKQSFYENGPRAKKCWHGSCVNN